MMAPWRRFCLWLGAILLAWGGAPIVDAVAVVEVGIDPAIPRAVHRSFGSTGLPIDQFDDDFDLERTGKVQDVLHHSAGYLGIDHGLHTVGDVIVFLSMVQQQQRGAH